MFFWLTKYIYNLIFPCKTLFWVFWSKIIKFWTSSLLIISYSLQVFKVLLRGVADQYFVGYPCNCSLVSTPLFKTLNIFYITNYSNQLFGFGIRNLILSNIVYDILFLSSLGSIFSVDFRCERQWWFGWSSTVYWFVLVSCTHNYSVTEYLVHTQYYSINIIVTFPGNRSKESLGFRFIYTVEFR